MTTKDFIELIQNIKVGVRMPEGMEPGLQNVHAKYWQWGVQSATNAYKNFLEAGWLDRFADMMIEKQEAVDLSKFTTVIETQEQQVNRLRVRVSNTGDPDTDLKVIAYGHMDALNEIRQTYLDYANIMR